MERYLPPSVSWTHPQGGLFLWVILPRGADCMDLMKEAVAEKVAFIPGTAFFPNPADGRNALRLTFATASPEMIEEGIRRLGTAIEKQLAKLAA